jgi:hypothetical protein
LNIQNCKAERNKIKVKVKYKVKVMDKIAKNLEENKGFVKIKSTFDNVEYKVLDQGSESEKLEVANTLAHIRKDLNTLLIYLCKNPELWINRSIAYGVILTFYIHIPKLYDIFDIVTSNSEGIDLNQLIIKSSKDNLFNIQEMTPNNYGIIGLNKPKKIKKIKVKCKNGKLIEYEVADERSIHLTIRNESYSKILSLAIHEITHTTCNDIYWKEDNHKHPYEYYHTLMKQWAKECGIK